MVELAKCVSNDTIEEMSDHGTWLYSKYFSSVESITNITLDILNERVFPENTRFYEDWNLKHTVVRNLEC